jgi:hypothetical protein
VDAVVVPPELAEQVERVPPALEEHREAEDPVDRTRDVHSAHDENGHPGEQQPHDRIPVAQDGEDQGPDREAEPEQVERIAQGRMPVPDENQRDESLQPRRLVRDRMMKMGLVVHRISTYPIVWQPGELGATLKPT